MYGAVRCVQAMCSMLFEASLDLKSDYLHNLFLITEPEAIDRLKGSLPTFSTVRGLRLQPIEFEKDDDSNFHMDFIVATSNLRAENYSIPAADRHTVNIISSVLLLA